MINDSENPEELFTQAIYHISDQVFLRNGSTNVGELIEHKLDLLIVGCHGDITNVKSEVLGQGTLHVHLYCHGRGFGVCSKRPKPSHLV